MSVLQAYKDIFGGVHTYGIGCYQWSSSKQIDMTLYMHRCEFDLSNVSPYDERYYNNLTKVLQHMWYFVIRRKGLGFAEGLGFEQRDNFLLALYPHHVPLRYECVYDSPFANFSNLIINWTACDSWSGTGDELSAFMESMDQK